MQQLPLNLAVQLNYASENFFIHAGVRTLIDQLTARTVACNSSLSWVVGSRRSGKSHLAIRLMHDLQDAGLLPRIMTGVEFSEQIAEVSLAKSYLVIIDDAEKYFEQISPGLSGPFVAFAEKCRQVGAHVILLSAKPLSSLPCDEHVMSRLIPGGGFEIGAPDEDEVEELLEAMARQRGLNLTEVKRHYVSRRIRREVETIDGFLERLLLSGDVGCKLSKFQTLQDSL